MRIQNNSKLARKLSGVDVGSTLHLHFGEKNVNLIHTTQPPDVYGAPEFHPRFLMEFMLLDL